MGTAKPPPEAMGTPPGPPRQPFFDERLESLIRPAPDGVEIAGATLHVPSPAEPASIARHLRRRLAHRLLERRPNADEQTWRHFVSVVRGVVGGARSLDHDLERTLVRAIDGL